MNTTRNMVDDLASVAQILVCHRFPNPGATFGLGDIARAVGECREMIWPDNTNPSLENAAILEVSRRMIPDVFNKG